MKTYYTLLTMSLLAKYQICNNKQDSFCSTKFNVECDVVFMHVPIFNIDRRIHSIIDIQFNSICRNIIVFLIFISQSTNVECYYELLLHFIFHAGFNAPFAQWNRILGNE